MKKTLMTVVTLAAMIASARTFEVAAWRGETVAALVPDFAELGAAPAGIGVRVGSLKGVRYAPGPYSLQRLERLDRVVWGDNKSTTPRVVEVSVPATAKPGVYSCGAMTIRVVDRVLPPARDWQFYLDLWQHPWATARMAKAKPFSKEHYAAMRPVYELLATAGQKTITVSILDEPWDHQCRDAYHSMVDDADFRTFDEYVEFARSCGLGPDISCYSLCPWKLKEHPGTPEFERRWAPFLQRLVRHLKEKGWYRHTIMAMDEREPDQVKAIVDFVHRHAPGMRISMAGNRKPSDFKGITIDIYAQVAMDGNISPAFLAEAAERRAKGCVTTLYVCCAPTYPNTFLTSDPGEAFWLGAYPAFVGLDGFLRWAWNSWPEDPRVEASYGDWLAGDTFLCYPDGEPSWRFLELRNGIATAEKLRILKAQGLFTKEIEAMKASYDIGKANGNKYDFGLVAWQTKNLVNK